MYCYKLQFGLISVKMSDFSRFIKRHIHKRLTRGHPHSYTRHSAAVPLEHISSAIELLTMQMFARLC